MLKAEATPTVGGNLALTVRAAHVDSSKSIPIERLEEIMWYGGSQDIAYDLLAGKPARVDVTVAANLYYRTALGEYKEEKRTLGVKTAGGAAVLEQLLEQALDSRDYASAGITLSYVDNNLNLVSADTSWNNGVGRRPEKEAKPPEGYTLNVFQNGQTLPSEVVPEYMDYSIVTADDRDTLEFQLCKDGVPVPNEGKIPYQLVQEGTVGQGIATRQGFTLTQNVSYANNFYLFSAYFDGKEVFPIRDTYVEMRSKSLALQVEVTTDREAYRPAETAAVQVRVTDGDGNPVAGNLCLSIVDEAVFALREQSFDVLQSLYGRMDFSVNDIRKYTTTQGAVPRQMFGADGGKGGNPLDAYDVYRKDFKDTALFVPLTADADGRAVTSFKLPDNITTWRLTTACIGKNLYGGQSKEQLVTSLPFFASPVLSPKYLEGDEVAMTLQGHGTALDQSSEISYQVRVRGDGVDETHYTESNAYRPISLKLGTLPVGEYTVISTATFGSYRDTVELPLAVISSNLELVIHKQVDLNQLNETKAVRYPVVISVYDKEHIAFYRSVSSLLTHYCCRTDQRMSRFAAKRALSNYCDPDQLPQHIAVTDLTTAEMQNEDGGIGWYPKQASDPMLTVKVLLFAGDQFNLNRMARYFREVIDSHPDTKISAACYAGLAAIDSETAKEIHTILEKRPVMPLQERLYYIAGLARAGDTKNALAAYQEAVTPYLTPSGKGKKVAYTKETETDDALTATAWIAATLLEPDDADAFALYFADNRWGISTAFECMIYVTNYSKQIAGIPDFSYTANGRTHPVSLGLAGQKSFTFTKSQFESLSFQNVPASLTAMAYYIGEPSEVDIRPSDQLSIRKSITAQGNGVYTNTILVDFAADAPTRDYNISDWVPSNMRFSAMNADQKYTYRLEQEGQKLYFGINRTDADMKHVIITYETRKTFDAGAVIDRVYIIHADTGVNAYSEKTVT